MIFDGLTLPEFEKRTGAKWIPKLDIEEGIRFKKRAVTIEEKWLGRYFQKEIQNQLIPDVAIRWINPILGWGIFALRDFRKMEFIAEYTGKVRKRRRGDEKNSYCFEYLDSYTIDALDQGGLSRYINHSWTPNLLSNLATLDQISHIVLYTKEPIAKGAQLCYDYGPDYWAKRSPPVSL
jgi:SET domain-containing protein